MGSEKPKRMKRHDRRMAALRAQIEAQCRELGIDAMTLDIGGAPATAIGVGDSGAVALDRALRTIAKLVRANHAVWPAPTRERVAKAPDRVVPLRGGTAHAVQWPPDTIRLTQDEYDAATMLYEAHHTLHRSVGVASYGDARSRSTGNRLPLTERQQIAGEVRAAMRDEVIRRLGPTAWDCVVNFVLEMPMRPGDPRPLTWVEFGKLAGNPGDDTAARYVARTILKCACTVLASVMRERQQARQRAQRRA